MKIKLQTMLKNKLQWLLLLAALLGVSQGVWGERSYKCSLNWSNCHTGFSAQTFYPTPGGNTTQSVNVYITTDIGTGFNVCEYNTCGGQMLYVGLSSTPAANSIVRAVARWNSGLYCQNTVVIPQGKIYITPSGGSAIEMTKGDNYVYTAFVTFPSTKTFSITGDNITASSINNEGNMPAAGKPSSIRLNYTDISSSYTNAKITYNLYTNKVTIEEVRSFAAGEYIYLKNIYSSNLSSNWITSSKDGYIYMWGGSAGTHSYKFSLVEGSAGALNAVYRVQLGNNAGGTYTNFIITRGTGSVTDGSFPPHDNKTGDCTFPVNDKNYIDNYAYGDGWTSSTFNYYAIKPSSCTISLGGGPHIGSGTSEDPYIVEPEESLTFTISATHADPGMTGVRASVNTTASKENSASGSSVTVSKTASASSSADETWVGYAWAYKSSNSYTSSSYATSSNTIYTRTAGGCTPPTMAIAATSADVNSMTFNVRSTDAFDCDIDSWGVKAWTSSSCEGVAAFTQEGTGELTTTNQSVTVSGLSANTTYYFKSYAVTPSEERRSSTNTKTTLIVPPSTASSSVTSSTTATLTADAYSTGGSVTTTLSAAGFIYSQTKSYIDSNTEASATIANSSVKTVGATYSTEITNLEPNKTYYYKPRIYYSVTNNQSSFKGYGSTTYSFKTNNVFGTVSINNNGVSSVCLGSGTVTWNASASSGNPTSWTVSSSNTTVATATINSSGVITITPKAAGSTTITATAKRTGYDDKTSDGVTITVNAAPTITLTGVGGKSTSATYPWDYMTITATTTPADLVVNWTKLYSGSGSEPVNSVTKSASPSHTYKIKSAITSNPNSDKYTIKANGTSSGCAAIEAVYDVYINNPEGEVCD